MKPFLTFLKYFTFVLSLNIFAQSNREVKEKPLEIVLGIDRIIQLDFAASTKIQVGNESILTYQIIPQKREITFKGIKPGKTSVIIRNTVGDIKARYLITITSSDLSSKVMELKEYLGEVEGIEIGIKGKNVFVGGKIVVPDDMGMINIVLKGYPDVLNFVELSHQTQLKVAKKMEVELHKMGLRKVRVRVVNSAFWLVGRVDRDIDRNFATKIAKAFMPGSIATIAERERVVQKVGGKQALYNFIEFIPSKAKKAKPLKKMIKISAQFVEVVKEYMKIFGFKWSPLMSGGGGVIKYGRSKAGDIYTDSNGTLAGTISNLFPKLASAKAAGYARVVQSGMIVVKDGQTGNIKKSTNTKSTVSAGGKFSTSTATSASFDLTAKPTLQSRNKEVITLNVGVNVVMSDGGANATNNTLKSEVDVLTGETAVMGGIAIKKTSTAFDRDPPYGQIDYKSAGPGGTPAVPIFSFLKSKKYLNDRNQFVVFATPSIIETASENIEAIKAKFLKRGR